MDAQMQLLGLAAVCGVAAIMFKMWLNHVERMKGLPAPKQDKMASDARLERLEHAVESIAIEIERVSEGQRFVTKLLNEKAQPMVVDVAKPMRKVDTPH